jgi:DNA (cytosine-5)-methyltransferase 1
MKLLDLFCGAGGAAEGYRRSGFDVTGVDISPQPRYPFIFHQCDWREYFDQHWYEYDVIHASPPCQGYSVSRHIHKGSKAPLLIDTVREALKATDKPYIIENVAGARKHMIAPITLRGNMFGLRVIRDRLFESNILLLAPKLIPAKGGTNSHRGMSTGGEYICVAGNNFYVEEAKAAMGIDWMIGKELAQAIPPAYTEWIGSQVKNQLRIKAAVPIK